MKTIAFLFASIILLSACSREITTIQGKVLVTAIVKTKRGVKINTIQLHEKPQPVPASLFKVGDTIKVLRQARLK